MIISKCLTFFVQRWYFAEGINIIFFVLLKNGSEEQNLKYFQFVHAATIQAIVCFSNLYGYAKDKAGPLKPGVETVEGTVKTVVRPVYDRFHDVPIELLKFVDRKVCQFL